MTPSIRMIKLTQHDGKKSRPKTICEIYIDPTKLGLIISRVDTKGTDQIIVDGKALYNIKENPKQIIELSSEAMGCEEVPKVHEVKPRRRTKKPKEKK